MPRLRRRSAATPALLAVVLLSAAARDGAAAPFLGKGPMIGGRSVVPAAIAFDEAGNRYVAGRFRGTEDFDPGRAVATRTETPAGAEVFVSSFTPGGVWRWTTTFGGADEDRVNGLVVAGGAVYAVGEFASQDLRIAGLDPAISAGDSASAFVACLDAPTGAARTAFGVGGVVRFGGLSGVATAHAAVVGGGTLYVAGEFTAVNAGLGGAGLIGSSGLSDGLVLALDPATGAARTFFSGDGVQVLAGSGAETLTGIAFDGGVVFAAGSISSSNAGIGGIGLLATGAPLERDGIVIALDGSSGTPVTSFGGDGAVQVGGGADDAFSSLAVASGVVFAAGTTRGGTMSIDRSPVTFSAPGGTDIFYTALRVIDGAPAWSGRPVRAFGTAAHDDGAGLGGVAASASGGRVFIAGALGTADAAETASPDTGGVAVTGDAVVLAVAASTGALDAGFSGDGVETLFGGFAPGTTTAVKAPAPSLAAGPGVLGLAGTVSESASLGSGAPFPSEGAYVVLADPLTGATTNIGINRNPEFRTPIIASPQPVLAGKPVTFRAVATDPDGGRVKLTWEFEGGTFGTGKAPIHKFSVPGDLPVRCFAIDASGGRTEAPPFALKVLPAGTPHFDVTTASVRLDFRRASRDSVTITGRIPFPEGTPVDGRVLQVALGSGGTEAAGAPSLTASFVLDAAGRSLPDLAAPRNVVARIFPPGVPGAGGARRSPRVPSADGTARFTVTLRRGDFAALLAPDGLTNATVTDLYLPTRVRVTFDASTWEETFPLVWTATAGGVGVAK